MSLAPFQIRVLAGACIAKYDKGERSMNDIIVYYDQTPENNELIKAEILVRRPDMNFEST